MQPSGAACPSATVTKKNDGVDYQRDVIDLIDLELVRMHEVTTSARACYYLRHDGCGNLTREALLGMARFEAAHGLFATYFLLPPGSYAHQPTNYYGRWEDGRIVRDKGLASLCQELVDLGHDLGLHSDVVSLSLTTGVAPDELLGREVEFFSKHELRLRGTASHGQPLCRQLSYNNREIFSGGIRPGWEVGRTVEHEGRSVRLHSVDMADFGFEYEAYSLPRDSRISDSGGRWGGRIAEVRIPKERFAEQLDLEEFRSIMSGASPANGVKAFQLLIHPSHWVVS